MLFLLFSLMFADPATAAPPLSPATQAMIAPVGAAIDRVRARQATLPPPRDDTERLIRMGELDEAGRRAILALDFSRIPQAERDAATDAAAAPIEAVDNENQAALLGMVPSEGWFLRSRYGDEAALAAFQIVQHSDLTLWRRFLPVLEPLVARGEIDGQAYGLMFDRLATSEGRLQRYGTQWRCDNGKWRPYPMEDPTRLEARRATLKFPVTFEVDASYWRKDIACPQTRSPPPPGMNVTD